MVHKCGYFKVLGVFFAEPTAIHFIKEISKKIKLAPTSVRKHIKDICKQNFIKRKEAKPFDGFTANRENEEFIFCKRAYNLYCLKSLSDFLVSSYYPKLLVVYGSYSWGEDVESSDIDIFVMSKAKKDINAVEFEKRLKRKIHILMSDDINKLDSGLKKKIFNGIVLYGGFDG